MRAYVPTPTSVVHPEKLSASNAIRTCRSCQRPKHIEEIIEPGNRTKAGRSICIDCEADRCAKFYANEPERAPDPPAALVQPRAHGGALRHGGIPIHLLWVGDLRQSIGQCERPGCGDRAGKRVVVLMQGERTFDLCAACTAVMVEALGDPADSLPHGIPGLAVTRSSDCGILCRHLVQMAIALRTAGGFAIAGVHLRYGGRDRSGTSLGPMEDRGESLDGFDHGRLETLAQQTICVGDAAPGLELTNCFIRTMRNDRTGQIQQGAAHGRGVRGASATLLYLRTRAQLGEHRASLRVVAAGSSLKASASKRLLQNHARHALATLGPLAS